jgi:hypothetical protein
MNFISLHIYGLCPIQWIAEIDMIYRVYQNSTTKLQEWIPHIERRIKGYGNMGPEMYKSCPSVYLPSARRHVLIAGIKCETPVTIVTQVIKLEVRQEMHNYRVIRPFSNVGERQAGCASGTAELLPR